MKKVIALQSFDHDVVRRKGDSFWVSEQIATALQRKSLVRIEGEDQDPSSAAGTPSSASPAARVSRRTTAKRSASGEPAAQDGLLS